VNPRATWKAALPVRIAGLGSHLPSRVVTNDDLAQVLDTNDEWIRTRTGIRQRHYAAPEEATSDLAVEAGKVALADAGLGIEDISSIVVATTTPDHTIPGTAPLVAAKLGTEVTAFDVNAACSGFLYALRVGTGMVATGDEAVLVIGAETLTRIIDPQDRNVAILFGDGAGAVVLVPDDAAAIGPFDLGADGSDPSMLWAESGGTRDPVNAAVLEARTHFMTMRGGDVYRNAVARMSASSQVVLDRSGLTIDDIDLFVGHQANIRILDAVGKRLGITDDKVHITVDQHGNTSAASVPLALSDARDAGRLTAGDTVLLTAFGAGFTWGSTLLTWQPGSPGRAADHAADSAAPDAAGADQSAAGADQSAAGADEAVGTVDQDLSGGGETA
jgi:3-oxoacyl-[acyl-carrier-protein] synthase III